VPFRNDPAELLNDILTDIAKVEQFTRGADQANFERDDQIAYAVKYALLRISEAAHRLERRRRSFAPRYRGGIYGAWATACATLTTASTPASSG
jgi:uncharacterized protein with HEPN domain